MFKTLTEHRWFALLTFQFDPSRGLCPLPGGHPHFRQGAEGAGLHFIPSCPFVAVAFLAGRSSMPSPSGASLTVGSMDEKGKLRTLGRSWKRQKRNGCFYNFLFQFPGHKKARG